MRGLILSLVILPILAAAQPTPIADPIPEPIEESTFYVELEPVITGITSPLGVLFPEDGTGRLFVYDQAGQVLIVESGAVTGTLLDVSARLVSLGFNGGPFDERGLLGFALHPAWPATQLIYTYTSEPAAGTPDFTVPGGPVDHHGVLAEWAVVGNGADTGSRREILRWEEPQFNHNGGPTRFGPDGYLYIALGDGGAADDDSAGHGAEGNGQSLDTVLGKLLRIDVTVDLGDTPGANGEYAIPQDNPFVGIAGLDEIYAYGFRNPYAFSFDQLDDTLYLADVGQNDIEELNIVTKGGNYGWRVKEGTFLFDPNGTDSGFVYAQQTVPGLIDPIAEYDHDEGLSIIGGFVYRGSDSRMFGRYIAGDFSRGFSGGDGRLFYVDTDNEFKELLIGSGMVNLGLFVKGFAQDASGEVYVCVSSILGPFGSGGAVYKLSFASSLPASQPIGLWLLVATLTTLGALLFIREKRTLNRR